MYIMLKVFHKLKLWLSKNIDLVLVVFATCITWFGNTEISSRVNALINEPRFSEKIFENSSHVYEYSNGKLSWAKLKFASNDIVLYYFYANWDSESIKNVKIISKISENYNKIPIVAVNCWIKDESCYQEIAPKRYPIISVLLGNFKFIRYWNEINEYEILKFLNEIQYPFLYPHSEYDIDSHLLTHDMLMIFYLNSSSSGFHKKVKIIHEVSSIMIAEWKGYPKIRGCVVMKGDLQFSQFAQKYNLTHHPNMLISFNNDPKVFKGRFVVADILDFMESNRIINFQSISVRPFISLGTKSIYLQTFLKRGVNFIYFYDNGISEFQLDNIRNRILFEMLAHKFKNCKIDKILNSTECGKLWITKLIHMLNEYHHNYRYYSICQQPPSEYDECIDENFPYKLSELEQELVNESHVLDFEINFNRSATFYSISKKEYPQFLKKFGFENPGDVPFIAVIDLKNEKIHQTHQISLESFYQLIKQFKLNNLTNHIISDLNIRQIKKQTVQNHLLIQPITYKLFQTKLLDPSFDLIVFYYTPWCTYCTSLMNLYVMLARYFENYPTVHFTSIDTFQNDLPFQYQSELVPALILYPKGRKFKESYVFSMLDPSINLSKLVEFVILHSGDRYMTLNQYQNSSNSQKQNKHSNQNSQRTHKKLVNSKNTMCDINCVNSASEIVLQIRNKLQKQLKQVYLKHQLTKNRLKWFCSSETYLLHKSTLKQSPDWLRYHNHQLQINHQVNLVNLMNNMYKRISGLNNTLTKFQKLYSGIENVKLNYRSQSAEISDAKLKKSFHVENLVENIAQLSNVDF